MEILHTNKEFTPRANQAYNDAWKIMTNAFILLFVVQVLYLVISSPVTSLRVEDSEFHWYFIPILFFGIAFGLFIAGPIQYSTSWVFLKAVRGETIEIRDMFIVFQRNYWNAVAGTVIVGIIVAIGVVMLIVPGIIFACRLAFVPFLIIDREMDISSALEKSWDMTKGHGWQIFLVGFLGFFIVILGLICLFFGVIISMMWINTTIAVMYQAVVEKDGHFVEVA